MTDTTRVDACFGDVYALGFLNSFSFNIYERPITTRNPSRGKIDWAPGIKRELDARSRYFWNLYKSSLSPFLCPKQNIPGPNLKQAAI